MTVSRLAANQPDKPGVDERRRRHSVLWYLFIALSSGAVAAVIATIIAALPALGSVFVPSPKPNQITANSLFPSPPAVHKVVNVYDPAPPQAPAPPRVEPSPSPRPHPSGSPQPSPTAQPTDPGDN